MTKRRRLILAAFTATGLGLLAAAGFLATTLPDGTPKRGAVLDITGTVIPPAPTSEAPPFKMDVAALGCKQNSRIATAVGDGVLVENIGKVSLLLGKADPGLLAQPSWPLAPGSWVHYRLGAAATYTITGTRSSCTAAGIAAPHFSLSIVVTTSP